MIAAQQEILEKELGEIQKVLFAMQVYRFLVLIVFISLLVMSECRSLSFTFLTCLS